MMKAASRKIVTFSLGDDLFGAEVDQVERVLRYRAPTHLPDAPEWMMGAIEHNGRPIPVVDMRRRLSLAASRPRFLARIVVFTTPAGPVGAVVDAVLDMARIPECDVQPPPELYHGLSGELLRGLAVRDGRLLLILDASRLLSSVDRIVFERAVANEEASANAR